MANNVQLIQPTGRITLDAQVEAQAKLGWALSGATFMLNGLPAQVLVKSDKKALAPRYVTATKDGMSSMADTVTTLLSLGYKIFGLPYDLNGQAAQPMIGGDIEDLTPGHVVDPKPEVDSTIKIRHLGDVTTHTVTIDDKNHYLVFDHAGTVEVTLPLVAATDDDTFTCLMCNTLGSIDLKVTNGSLVAYAPHADVNATIGLTRGAVNWYATGTNVKPGDA